MPFPLLAALYPGTFLLRPRLPVVGTMRDRLKLNLRQPRERRPPLLLCDFGVLADVVHGVLDGADLLGIFIRNLDVERFLERHHQFHGIQRVGPEVVHERRVGSYFGLIDSQLFHNDLFHLLVNRSHSGVLLWAINHSVYIDGRETGKRSTRRWLAYRGNSPAWQPHRMLRAESNSLVSVGRVLVPEFRLPAAQRDFLSGD